MSHTICRKIQSLYRRYQTRDPFELAKRLGIQIMMEDLGSINGYYNKIYRMKQIHINQNRTKKSKLFICAHELGHAVLHPDSNTTFLLDHTYLSVSKIENEANEFAVLLLIPDEVIFENRELTTAQLARLLGYEQPLIELRLKVYTPFEA